MCFDWRVRQGNGESTWSLASARGEGGHGFVTVEQVSEAKGEREDLGSQNQAGRAQGLADGAGKSS